jgi:hypothetical protein
MVGIRMPRRVLFPEVVKREIQDLVLLGWSEKRAIEYVSSLNHSGKRNLAKRLYRMRS